MTARTTGREVCVKVGSLTYCKASPIEQCNCKGPSVFKDPFQVDPEPDGFENPGALLRELARVLTIWEASQQRPGSGDLEKFEILWKISQLLLLKEVDAGQPFVITVL